MQISEVKNMLEHMLKMLTVDVRRIEVVAGDPHPLLSVTTPDSGILIGVQGENLRALNHLVKKMVESRSGGNEPLSFLVDVNGYHRKRIVELKQQARILAERARVFKSDVMMDPLNSYERMIIHAVFSDDPEIHTESTGVGKGRRVVFKYRKAENATAVSDRALFIEEGMQNN